MAQANIPFPVIGQEHPIRQLNHRNRPYYFTYLPLPYLRDPTNNPIGWCIGVKGAMIKFIRKLATAGEGNAACEITVFTDPTTNYRQWTPALHAQHGPTRVEVYQPVSGGEQAQGNMRKVIRLFVTLMVDKDLFWGTAVTFPGFQQAFDEYLAFIVNEFGDNDLNARYPGVPAWLNGH